MSLPRSTRRTTTRDAAFPHPGDVPRAPRRWLALAVLAMAQFLVILDASIVNIALPSMGRALALSTTALSWVVTAYVLPFGGLLLLGGRLADRFGHRRLFLLGVAGFVTASAAAGLAGNGATLFAARAVQGASAALLAPASLALVTQIFTTTADRAKALGVWGAVAGSGSAAGVLLGGVLTSGWGWEWVFFVNVPVGLAALILTPALVSRDPRTRATSLDLPGAALVTTGLTSLVGALSQVSQRGATDAVVLVLAGLGAALLVAFVLVEAHSDAPLVPRSIFRSSGVRGGNIAMLFVGGATTGLFFALSIYLQAVLGDDALTSGLSQLPLAGTLVLVAGVVPSVIRRVGERATVMASLAVFAAGLAWLAVAPVHATFVRDLLGPSMLIGIGLAGAFVAGTQLAVHGVRGDEAGLASGLVNTSQQVGAALGLALLTTLSTHRTTQLLDAGTSAGDALAAGLGWAFAGAGVLAVLGLVGLGLTRRQDA